MNCPDKQMFLTITGGGPMLQFIANLKVKSKLFLLDGVVIIGFCIYVLFMLFTLNKVDVNGPIYGQIVTNKDLVADILPPPEYILETYLTALQIKDEKNPAELSTLFEKCQSLKKDFVDRHEYWEKKLPGGEMKEIPCQIILFPRHGFLFHAGKRICPSR
jgi:methyl-accepting chemotaxis protein